MRRAALFLTVAVFFLALANPSPGASRDLPTLFPIKQNGKWGFIDRTGKVIVPPQFKHAGDFHEERAGVKQGDPPQRFSGGLAPVIIGEKCGFADQTGKLVIPARFLGARNFSEGLAAIEVCPGRGYIDRSGKFVWQTKDPCDQWGQPPGE